MLPPVLAPCHAARVGFEPSPTNGAQEAPNSKAGGKHETREVSGLVLGVEANRITLQAKDGRTLTLTTFEDYSDRVTIGAEVRATYYPQDSGDSVLKSLDFPAASSFVPVGNIQSHVHRVALMPSSQVPDADGLFESMREYLHTNFGWYVAPQYLADEVRKGAGHGGSTLDAMDPASGKFDLSKYLGESQGIVPQVASGTRSDAVLEVNVSQVEAPVNRMVASWDGVEEPVSGAAARTLAKFTLFSHKGEVPAATVELKLWDATGKLLWRNRRGLAVLEVLEGKSNHLRQRPLPEFLMNTQAVQAWMAATFKSMGAGPTPGAQAGP
ncbi:MAG TPA: hypothetical protein VMT20_21505 [Terriglobia bacterium]|nr:hypothetical protein [Terriglobia bacterium]